MMTMAWHNTEIDHIAFHRKKNCQNRRKRNASLIIASFGETRQKRAGLVAFCWLGREPSYVFFETPGHVLYELSMSWDGEKEFVQEVSSITTHKPPVSQKKVSSVTKIAIKHPKVPSQPTTLIFIDIALLVVQECCTPYREVFNQSST